MSLSDTTTQTLAPHANSTADPEHVALVLQGGGALGAYQAGVYEAMHEAGLQPDWVIGTSIGAINASLIAGNAPEHRLDRLRALWRRLEYGGLSRLLSDVPVFGGPLATWMTMLGGLEAFFKPNVGAFASAKWPLGPEHAGFYSTEPLQRLLTELVDFDLINSHACRLTVGAANVRTAEMHYFDSRDMPFDVRHVMASGALPPAFPAIRIDNELYWDGGILSNTPVEAVFDDNPRRSGLVIAVHIWNPHGPEPASIEDVLNRQKDVQYASRAESHIRRQQQLHRLRHIIAELAARLPEAERQSAATRMLASYGCLTQMHVVRLLAPALEGESHTKDIDFSPAGIRARWQAGLESMREIIRRKPWTEPVDPLAGFVLHDATEGMVLRRR